MMIGKWRTTSVRGKPIVNNGPKNDDLGVFTLGNILDYKWNYGYDFEGILNGGDDDENVCLLFDDDYERNRPIQNHLVPNDREFVAAMKSVVRKQQ